MKPTDRRSFRSSGVRARRSGSLCAIMLMPRRVWRWSAAACRLVQQSSTRTNGAGICRSPTNSRPGTRLCVTDVRRTVTASGRATMMETASAKCIAIAAKEQARGCARSCERSGAFTKSTLLATWQPTRRWLTPSGSRVPLFIECALSLITRTQGIHEPKYLMKVSRAN